MDQPQKLHSVQTKWKMAEDLDGFEPVDMDDDGGGDEKDGGDGNLRLILDSYRHLERRSAARVRQHWEEMELERKEEEEVQRQDTVKFAQISRGELKMMTGFDFTEFVEIHRVALPALTPRAYGRRGRRPRVLTHTEDRLLMFLTWLRYAEPFHKLAASFGVSKTVAKNTTAAILTKIHPILTRRFIDSAEQCHRELAEWEMLLPGMPEVAAMIDVTVQRCSKPSGEASRYYNGHKKCYCMKNVCLHNIDGRVIFVRSYPGSSNDVTLALKPTVLNKVMNLC